MWNKEINTALTEGFQAAVNIIDSHDKDDCESMYQALKNFLQIINEYSPANAMLAVAMFVRSLG